jgi:hypothetical protein
MQIVAHYRNGVQATVRIDKPPERCPICHHFLQPVELGNAFGCGDTVEKIYRCPRENCERTFIARYTQQAPNFFALAECVPSKFQAEIFSEIIQKVSKKFCDFYEQASRAEQQSLLLVCGPWYRKALEFLIKDYVCGISPPEQTEAIKKTALGKCIKDHITNAKIVTVASRTAWLGNDETHYLRTWEDKDLTDLKKLINLTVHWIEMEELTKDMVVEMPEPAKP